MSGRSRSGPPDRALAPAAAWQVALALVAVYVVWGSTYLAIRIVVGELPPLLSASARFLFAGFILYVATIRTGDTAGDRPGRLEWRDAAIIGGFLLTGGNGLVSIGEVTIPSGITALLVATMPLWVAILGRFAFGIRLGGPALAGIAVGFVGVAILVWPESGAASLDPLGLACVLGAPLLWAVGSLYTRRAHLVRRPLVGTAMQMLCGGALLGVVAVILGEPARLDLARVTPDALIALAYLIGVGSLVGYTAFAWLLRVAPISLVSTYAYVNPVVAVLLGALVRAEPIGPRTLLAGAVIVSAVAIIVWARGREEEGHPAEIAETT